MHQGGAWPGIRHLPAKRALSSDTAVGQLPDSSACFWIVVISSPTDVGDRFRVRVFGWPRRGEGEGLGVARVGLVVDVVGSVLVAGAAIEDGRGAPVRKGIVELACGMEGGRPGGRRGGDRRPWPTAPTTTRVSPG